jgi:hypothetical protein
MVSRCANPSCGAEFKYLHEGRLYHFLLNDRKSGPSKGQLSAAVPFWWLCSRCSLSLALIPDGGSGVRLVPLPKNGNSSQQNSEERNPSYEQTAHFGC